MKTKTIQKTMKTMHKVKIYVWAVLWLVLAGACVGPRYTLPDSRLQLPATFGKTADTLATVQPDWRTFFEDKQLQALIDSALQHNRELNILLQEIVIAQNEVLARKGEYLPFVRLGAAAEMDKVGEYTRYGAVEKQLDIRPGEVFPEPFSHFELGAYASWEIDIWKRLRNAKKAAALRYMASIEGRRFVQTQVIAEVAEAYYELMALDNLLAIVEEYARIQENALELVRQRLQAGRDTRLAVNRFAARLLKTKNLRYAIRQRITETENRLRFLTGQLPDSIVRSSGRFLELSADSILTGVPARLLQNRPDVRRAELELAAAKLDVQSARALFYPSLDLRAGIGFQAFNPAFLLAPESMLYNLAGDLMAPLINRNAIRAAYNSANARQLQALYAYEQTLIQAYTDVVNQLAKLDNYTQSLQLKSEEVRILTESINIANALYRAADADYLEVLLTQIEAMDARLELVEVKLKQLQAKVQLYRALGGGWQ
jgi:NodT family efflux transporter outer membrane factor (OMF) lipoprotein